MPYFVSSGRKIGVSMMISTEPSMKVPADQDEEDDQHHRDIGILGDAQHPVGDHLGHLLEHDAVAKDRRQREQEHDGADIDQAALDGLAKTRQRQHAVGEEPDATA